MLFAQGVDVSVGVDVGVGVGVGVDIGVDVGVGVGVDAVAVQEGRRPKPDLEAELLQYIIVKMLLAIQWGTFLCREIKEFFNFFVNDIA